MPAAVNDPSAEEHLEWPNGRGLCMMRHLMTGVRFVPPGNCVVMMFERRDALDSPVGRTSASQFSCDSA